MEFLDVVELTLHAEATECHLGCPILAFKV
jgi:hypothetical protein